MRALSLDKPSTMGRFLLTSIEDAHKWVDCMPCHEMRLKPFIFRIQRKGLRRETNRRTVTIVSDVAAPRCAPGFHIIAACDKDNTVHLPRSGPVVHCGLRLVAHDEFQSRL